MHEGHRKRMKDRFLKDGGFENFAQHEVLEMLLYSTNARSDTNPIAHDLMAEFGNLANVLEASPTELKKIDGIGESSAFLLSMIPALCRAYTLAKWDRTVLLGNYEITGRYVVDLFMGKNHEEFHIICVDSNRQVFYEGCVMKGTINEVPAYPRLIVEEVLKHNAQYVYLAHNHPGGSTRPSEEDYMTTKKIMDALTAVDVTLLDHLIVSGNSFYSMEHMGDLV